MRRSPNHGVDTGTCGRSQSSVDHSEKRIPTAVEFETVSARGPDIRNEEPCSDDQADQRSVPQVIDARAAAACGGRGGGGSAGADGGEPA